MWLKTTNNDEAQEVSLALNINNNITQHSTQKIKIKNQVDYHSKIILLFYDCNV